MPEKQIYIWIIGGLLDFINILLWARIRRIEKVIKETNSKSNLIKKNYLYGFERLDRKLNEVEKNIIHKICEIRIAVPQLGVSEINEEKDNSIIIKYAGEKEIIGFSHNEIPWCSVFVNWCCKKAGLEYTGKANARTWLDIGIKSQRYFARRY